MLGFASTILSVALGAVHASPDRPVLRETSLGPSGESPAEGGVQFAAFDPESRRFAFVTKRDGRSRLVVDGATGSS